MSPQTTEPTKRWQHRPPPWRRKLIVDPRFQWNVIWRVTAQSVFTLLLATVSLMAPLVSHVVGNGHEVACADEAAVFLYLHDNWWWVAATSLLCAALAALRLSHRIAGPLVRFKRVLEGFGSARFDAPLQTRTHDYLKQEVEVLNRTGARLAGRFAALRASHDELVQHLESALQESEFSISPAAQEALRSARASAIRMAAHLDAGDESALAAEATAAAVPLATATARG